MRQISVVIDSPPEAPYHQATIAALNHAIEAANVELPVVVVPTAQIDDEFVATFVGGVVIGPGSPYDVPESADAVVRSARERGVPLVGT